MSGKFSSKKPAVIDEDALYYLEGVNVINSGKPWTQDDEAALVYAVDECRLQNTPADQVFKRLKLDVPMGSLLASMTEEEIARKYNNLVKRGKCLPLDSPEADSTEADSTEAATTVRRDVTPIAKPPVGQRSARSRRFIVNQNLDVGKATKGPKQWNPDEDDALIDVVKQYKFEYMTVTEVFYGDGDKDCYPRGYGDEYGYFFKLRVWGWGL
ncbi:hypothetical protein L195_g031555 [Trifolium pratense]|uniref:Uncharacterized protein n=1 Tax=Trifolium pratense TaxID=57577 RepID=A0A2K3LAR9_TRIPR|nr:hypothetical protein L195_g031555 [Trifolium pratense]